MTPLNNTTLVLLLTCATLVVAVATQFSVALASSLALLAALGLVSWQHSAKPNKQPPLKPIRVRNEERHR